MLYDNCSSAGIGTMIVMPFQLMLVVCSKFKVMGPQCHCLWFVDICKEKVWNLERIAVVVVLLEVEDFGALCQVSGC